MTTLQIDPVSRKVRQGDAELSLGARAFVLLAVLASRPDHVFTADELKAAVWPGREVEDQNLRMQVLTLRKALGDANAVLNVAGRGYQLGLPAQLVKALPKGCNVPHWSGTLLGRQADEQALMQLLDQHRLVTVLGPGGIGKTRLAQRLLLRRLPRCADGAWWVDLAALQPGAHTVASLAQAVAHVLGVQTAALEGPSAAQHLGSALVGWQTLVLLDNAEHLVGGSGGNNDKDSSDDSNNNNSTRKNNDSHSGPLPALVRALLQAAPGLRLLVTTQRVLKLPEEWVYRLDTLAVPAVGAAPAQVRASAALQLLERRAQATDQRYVLSDADLPAAAAVVRRLDGIALAIEMAAARLPLLGAQALQAQLDDRLHLLGGNDAAAPPRHRTLRAALDWSHALLSRPEQDALHQLSVFCGPFRVGSAQQLLLQPGQDPAAILQTLDALVGKSLLQSQPGDSRGAPPRLRLLESTRLHAQQALGAGGDPPLQALRRRHTVVMAELARRAKDDFFQSSDAAWLARWGPDHEDFMRAFDGAHDQGDADAASAIIELLVLGANITGRVGPAMSRAAASRQLAQAAGAQPRARLLGWGSNLAGTGTTRMQAAAERVGAWREVADAQGLCTSLAVLATACEEAGDRAAADAALAECSALEQPHWPARLRRRCAWLALSTMALMRGDEALLAAAGQCSEHLALELQQLGAEREWALVRAHQAQVLRWRGQPQAAVTVLRQLVAVQMKNGCVLDAGNCQGFEAAALVEWAEQVGDAGAGAGQGAQLRAQACAVAEQALLRLAPLPALMRHFIEPLALLVCRLGHPADGALLLAAAQRLRSDAQYAHDVLSARTAQRVQALLLRDLQAPERAAAQTSGARLAAAPLREWALSWLRIRGGSAANF